ncbi:MAG: HD domain-containing protein [Candidatus Eremiobacteraeota bacterium]|nr:HD domain-containing protein [Candidatus Eremiobacteraeota bacterium]
MLRHVKIPTYDLILCLSAAIDLISPRVAYHHVKAAYGALSIAAEMGFSHQEKNALLLSGMLHDCGALSLKEKMEIMEFEMDSPHYHSDLGGRLLSTFEPFMGISSLVRHHHVPWDFGGGQEFHGGEVALSSHVLHLADRVAILLEKNHDVLKGAAEIRKKIEAHRGKLFHPEVVEAFLALSEREYFWFDLASPSLTAILADALELDTISLDTEGLLSLTRLVSHIIDFRSPFTSTHTSGVAASAEVLCRLAGFSEHEAVSMRIAGFLHDLGKLAVPKEILEKPGKLSEEEFNIVRCHTYHTYRLLEQVPGFSEIASWAAFHHEHLDGKGYPFHIDGRDLSLGARIMAVADVNTAITEDRPYRKGMEKEKALEVLDTMVSGKKLDGNLVQLLKTHFEEANGARKRAQESSRQEFDRFLMEPAERR